MCKGAFTSGMNRVRNLSSDQIISVSQYGHPQHHESVFAALGVSKRLALV